MVESTTEDGPIIDPKEAIVAHPTRSADGAEPGPADSARDRPYLPAMGNPRLLPFYDAFTRLAGVRSAQWQLVAQAGIAPGHTVLEIGAGTGTVLLLARRAVASATLVGLDPDPQALAVARRRAAGEGVELRLDHGYADHLPHPDGSVDRVLSAFMFHHLPGAEKAAALREAHRVLAPGGSLHLLDLGGPRRSGGLGRFLHRGHGHGDPGRHGHGADRGPADGHGALSGPEIAPAGDVVRLMREAGFDEAAVVGRRRAVVGPVTFYRAAR